MPPTPSTSSPVSTATAPTTGTGAALGQAGPELLDHRLALYGKEARMVFGATTFRDFVEMLASSDEDSDVRDGWVTRMRPGGDRVLPGPGPHRRPRQRRAGRRDRAAGHARPGRLLVLAVLSGLGGGLIRDTLLQHGTPVALSDAAYLITALVGAGLAYLIKIEGRARHVVTGTGRARLLPDPGTTSARQPDREGRERRTRGTRSLAAPRLSGTTKARSVALPAMSKV